MVYLPRTSLISRYPTTKNRRDIIAIIAEILTEINFERTRVSIMRKCNLNSKQIEIFTKILLEKKLLAKEIDDKGQVTFIVTSQGKNFIKKFHYIQAQIESDDFKCS